MQILVRYPLRAEAVHCMCYLLETLSNAQRFTKRDTAHITH
jgi:hypothetical protein